MQKEVWIQKPIVSAVSWKLVALSNWLATLKSQSWHVIVEGEHETTAYARGDAAKMGGFYDIL